MTERSETTPRRDRTLRRAEAKASIISHYDNIANVPSEASAERSESAIYHNDYIMPAPSIARRAISRLGRNSGRRQIITPTGDQNNCSICYNC